MPVAFVFMLGGVVKKHYFNFYRIILKNCMKGLFGFRCVLCRRCECGKFIHRAKERTQGNGDKEKEGVREEARGEGKGVGRGRERGWVNRCEKREREKKRER